METLPSQRSEEIEKGCLIIQNLIKKHSRKRPRFTLQRGFYHWLAMSKSTKTKAIVEKFYFNSKLNTIKALWVFRTMFHRDLQKPQIDQKAKLFLDALMKVVDYFEIKRVRSGFSLLTIKNDLRIEKLQQVVMNYKMQVTFRIHEFCTNYRIMRNTTSILNAISVLMRLQDKLKLDAFAKIASGRSLINEQNETKFVMMLKRFLFAAAFKKLHALKIFIRQNDLARFYEYTLFKLESLIYQSTYRFQAEAFSQIKEAGEKRPVAPKTNYDNLNRAFEKLAQTFFIVNRQAKLIIFRLMRHKYLEKPALIGQLLSTLQLRQVQKIGLVFRQLRQKIVYRDPKSLYLFLFLLHSLFKKQQKLGLEQMSSYAQWQFKNNLVGISINRTPTCRSLNQEERRIVEENLRSFRIFLEDFLQFKMYKQKVHAFGALKEHPSIASSLNCASKSSLIVLKDTRVGAILIKALIKKDLITKFIHFKIWERYTIFLRKWQINGLSSAYFFQVLNQRGARHSTARKPKLIDSRALKLQHTLKRILLKHKCFFFGKLKQIYADKSWSFQLAMALLLRNIFNRNLRKCFVKIIGSHLIPIESQEQRKRTSTVKRNSVLSNYAKG